MNTINTQNNLAVLAQKEREINKLIEEQRKLTLSEIEQVLDYTDEEKEKIDDFMQHIYIIDDLIKAGKGFANSVQYNLFVVGYNQLSPRIKKHFEEIFREFRLKYFIEKISKNLVNLKGPKNDLNNYFNDLKEEYPDFDLQYFYQTFPNAKDLLDEILKK